MENRKELIKKFEESLFKPHNYVRIANSYLKYLIKENARISQETKNEFLKGKAAVYKTALNKFFRNLGIKEPLEVFELEEVKTYSDIYNRILKGLSESSKEVYYNIIIGYKTIYGNILNGKEFESYIENLKNRASKATVKLHYSCIKKVFDFYKVSIWFIPYKIDKQRKSKTYIMTDSKKGIFKIGRSKNPNIREKTLQSQKPTIRLLAICDKLVEKVIHKEYEMFRVRGEWFKLSKIQIQEIVSNHNFKFC